MLKIVGQAAPPEFVARVEALAAAHHPDLTVDITRAYHFGARYNAVPSLSLYVALAVDPPSPCAEGPGVLLLLAGEGWQ